MRRNRSDGEATSRPPTVAPGRVTDTLDLMGARSLIPATFAGGGVLAFVFACGQTLAPPPNDPAKADAAVDADADAGPEPEPVEQHADTFACGIAACTVDTQVCCLVDGGASCNSVAAGCGGGSSDGDAGSDADAGGPSGPTLMCTTYNNCKPTDDCCWSKDTGSVCKDNCNNGEEKLCTLFDDNCGINFSCRRMTGDPLGSTVGHCTYDGMGSSSGGSSGGGSSWGGW